MRRTVAGTFLAFSSLWALAAGATPTAANDAWQRDLSAARKLAKSENKLIFIDLYADWCGWCKQLEAKVFSTPTFKAMAEQFVLLRLDVEDGRDGTRIQEQFNASSLPTSLLIDPDLGLAGRIDGYLPAEPYVQAIKDQLKEREVFLARYERLRESTDPGLLHRLGDELHERGDGRRAAEVYLRLIELGKPKAAELGRWQYSLADSLRLSGELAKAAEINGRTRGDAEGRGDRALIEACDFLAFRIAKDRGDCGTAIAALESFVKTHPASVNNAYARRTLRTLQKPGAACS